MKYSNRFNLPGTIVRATQRNAALYSKGPAHRSVTQLIQSPRIDTLRKRHYVEIERDVSDEWWALLGSAVHAILELGRDESQIVEERLYMEIDGWIVSGQLDCQTMMPDGKVKIEDYKVTSVFSVMSEKDEWEQQLNLQSLLLKRAKNLDTESVNIVAIIRDWERRKAENDPLYPQAPIVSLQFRLWSEQEQEEYAKQRVNEHRQTEMLAEIGADLPGCGQKDRWVRGEEWAVKKKGGKRATHVLPTEAEAEAILSSVGADKYEIEYRPGRNIRCEGNYCHVAEWCQQWQEIKDGQGIREDTVG